MSATTKQPLGALGKIALFIAVTPGIGVIPLVLFLRHRHQKSNAAQQVKSVPAVRVNDRGQYG